MDFVAEVPFGTMKKWYCPNLKLGRGEYTKYVASSSWPVPCTVSGTAVTSPQFTTGAPSGAANGALSPPPLGDAGAKTPCISGKGVQRLNTKTHKDTYPNLFTHIINSKVHHW